MRHLLRRSLRPLFLIHCFALWAASASDTSAANARHAILVGVGDYHPKTSVAAMVGGGPGPTDASLKAPLNDVQLMREILAPYGFNDDNTTILVNEEAEHDKIVEAVEEHLLSLESDELAVFYFSGHGIALDYSDEEEERDEALVPYDGLVLNESPRVILDDTIYEWITKLTAAGRHAVFIFDSCFSGGSGRARVEEKGLGVLEVSRAAVQTDGSLTLRAEEAGLRGTAVFVAASRADEPAIGLEHDDGRYRSVFTWLLHQTLRPVAGTPPATWAALRDQITQQMSEDARFHSKDAKGEIVFNQTPQFSGALDGKIFKTGVPFSHSIAARRLSSISALLSAGSDVGVTAGSIFKLFRADQVPWRSAQQYEAKAKVVAVSAASAELSVVEGALSPGQLRAVEIQYAWPEVSIDVVVAPSADLDPFQQMAVADATSRLQFVEIEHDLSEADVVLSGSGTDLVLTTAEGEQIGAPIERSSGPLIKEGIVDRLTNYAKWRRLYQLQRQPLAPRQLTIRIEPRSSDSAIAGQEVVVPTGSAVRLSVTSRDPADLRVQAVLLKPDFTLRVCEIGSLKYNQLLRSGYVNIGSVPGEAAWIVIVTHPQQAVDLAFLETPSGARSVAPLDYWESKRVPFRVKHGTNSQEGQADDSSTDEECSFTPQ